MRTLFHKLISLIIAMLCTVCFACPVFAEPNLGITPAPDTRVRESPSPFDETGDGEDALLPQGALRHRRQFSADYYLKGLFSQCYEYFYTGEWEISSAKLNLVYSATPLLVADSSDFTVSLNDEPVYSGRVPAADGMRHEVMIELPVESILTGGANAIKVELYVRSGANACVDDVSASTWFNVFRESEIELIYTPTATCDNIAEFYDCFMSIEALENDLSGILIPQKANAQELSAAAGAAAGAANLAVLFYNELPLKRVRSLAEITKYRYALYISAYENLLGEVRSALSAYQRAQAQKGAVMALLKMENSNILVLTGKNALAGGGVMLSNPDYMRQITKAFKEVDEEGETIMPHRNVEQYIELTTGAQVKGNFRQSAVFHVEYPMNRKLSHASEISLDFRYSENLDFDRALVTVYIDEVPIGSKKLTKEGALGDTLRFYFPEDLDITGSFSVRVAFDLDAGERWCMLTPDQMPWAYISDTSMLKLSSVDDAAFVFENYPSPFLRDGSFNNVVMLLPDAPRDADLDAMHGIMLTLGRFLKDNRGSLRVAFYSEPGALDEANIIAIGRAGENGMIAAHQKLLPFKFSPDGNLLLSNERMLIESAYGQSAGVCQLIPSPYSQYAQAILIVSGVTDEAVRYAAEYLEDKDLLWQLSGNAYVAAPDEDPVCFSFELTEEYAAPISERTDNGLNRTNSTTFIVIAVSIVILCAVALTMLIIKRKGGGRHER